MTLTLPATHLLRQFLLFALLVVFLLLFVRAGHALWQFPAIEKVGSPGRLFLTGLRFDLSIIGVLCLPPLVLGSLLGMFDATRAIAKWLVVVLLVASLVLILIAELITPFFLATEAVRPTAATFADPAALATSLGEFVARYPLPAAIGSLLVVLIIIAYVIRMETGRFLRHRLSRPSTLVLLVLGSIVCIVMARSQLDPREPALSLADAAFGAAPVVDAIATNSAWTTVFSLLQPAR